MEASIEPIAGGNVEAVVQLLQERNGTLPDYTRWKYGTPNNERFRGVLAILGDEPIGCFGLIPRQLRLADTSTVPCGWFADWYVSPTARGKGLGTALLQALRAGCPLVFGHPEPIQAQQLCAVNGYRPIGFQSWRRVVLRPWIHERARTSGRLKAAKRAVFGSWERAKEILQSRLTGARDVHELVADSSAVYFADADHHGRWILAQPVSPDVSRRPGHWNAADLSVDYVDDCFPSGQMRRRVVFAAGQGRYSVESWSIFLQDSRQAGCSCLEIFTTEEPIDRAWGLMGALRHYDPPVLFAGEPDVTGKLSLHGWDRENWTYLAPRVCTAHR